MSVFKPRAFWPLVINASNKELYWHDGASNGTGSVATGTYLTPEDLATAVAATLNTGTNPLAGATCTVSSTGRIVITWNGPFTMRWSVTTNSIYVVLGEVAVNKVASNPSVGVYTCTSTYQHVNGWYAEQAVEFDSATIRNKEMNVITRNVAGQTKLIEEAELSQRRVVFSWLPPEKTYEVHATSTYLNQAIETWWDDGAARFRYWEDATTLLRPLDYVLSQEAIKEFQPERLMKRKALYRIELIFWGYVA